MSISQNQNLANGDFKGCFLPTLDLLTVRSQSAVAIARDLSMQSILFVLSGEPMNLPPDLRNISVDVMSLAREPEKAWKVLQPGHSIIFVGRFPSEEQLMGLRNIRGFRSAFDRGVNIYHGEFMDGGQFVVDYSDEILYGLGFLDPRG